MRTLERKLARELWGLKGQMLSIAMVVAAGVTTVITMRGGYESLLAAQERYYRQARFADVWASLERAPERLRQEIERIPDVAAVDTRVTFLATLDVPGVTAPGLGRFVSIPVPGRPPLNDLRLVDGRLPAPGESDEAVVSESFAEEHGFEPGDRLEAVINGRLRELRIVGVGISPEHLYAVPPGALLPDDERYAVLWMARDVLGPAYDLDGAFNQVALRLAPGVDPAAAIARLDRLLDPYGGLGAYPRDRQPSHQMLDQELEQNRVMGTAVPAVFLGVAAFLLNLVLGRLIATQRTEIAVLKAFGYRDREVGGHYLGFSLAAVAVGAVLGTVGGAWLGDAYIEMYGQYFDLPGLRYELSWKLAAIACGVSALAMLAGAWRAVRQAVRLPPAEAMRPEPPATFRPGWIERAGVGRLLSPPGRMVLRNLERRPVRSLLSSLGVAFSVAILIVGMFLFDGLERLMDLQFRFIQREDLTVSFVEPRADSVRYELAGLAGVERVETFRQVAARLRAGHRDREVSIQALAPGGEMRRIVSADGRVHPLPAEGLVLNRTLADRLAVGLGDPVRVELLERSRNTGEVRVSGVIEDFLGLSATMSRDALERLTEGAPLADGAYLAVDGQRVDEVNARLKETPAVAGVSSPQSMLESFETELADSLFIAVAFLLGFAGVIAVGVIYNSARVSLSERGRELASLRVVGFHRGEVAVLLLGEQAVVTLLAIPVGWLLGYALSFAVVSSLDAETYRIPLVVSARTAWIAAGVTAVAAAVSGWIVRRRIDRLDLIEVLKTRE